MNTRIQVEHPVTEMVTGVDLVREQLRIAGGEAMSCGPLNMRGHAIEVGCMLKTHQTISSSDWCTEEIHRTDRSGCTLGHRCEEGDAVTPDYDPMLAKLIVWAPSREEALQRMGRALDEFVVLGCTTNVRFLRELCTNPDVVDGWTTTDMIDRLWPDGWSPAQSSTILDAGLLIAATCEFN